MIWSDLIGWRQSVIWSDLIGWRQSAIWSDLIWWWQSVIWSDLIGWGQSVIWSDLVKCLLPVFLIHLKLELLTQFQLQKIFIFIKMHLPN